MIKPKAILEAPRRWGKTTQLAGWALESEDRVVLTQNRDDARQLTKDFPGLRGRVDSVRTAHKLRGHRVTIGVDNWDDSYGEMLAEAGVVEVEFATKQAE